jgi:hypothetical protein
MSNVPMETIIVDLAFMDIPILVIMGTLMDLAPMDLVPAHTML